MNPDTTDKPDVTEISVLLRGNSVEFMIHKDKVARLETTLTKISLFPVDEPQMVCLETAIGSIKFLSSHMTGWIIFDNPRPNQAPA